MIVTIQGKQFDSEGKRVVIIRNRSGKLTDVMEANFVVQAGPPGLGVYHTHDAGWDFVRFGEVGETAAPDIMSETRSIPGIVTQFIAPPADMAQAMAEGKRGGRPRNAPSA